MNDLTSLRELGQAIDTELRGPRPRLRERVLAEFGRPPGRVRGRPRFLPGWRLAVTGGLAVALAATLLAVSTLRLLGAPPGATAQAATILSRAAAVAVRWPGLIPRPSRYVSVKTLGTSATFNGSSPDFTSHSELDLGWLSVTGRRNGLAGSQPRSNSAPADRSLAVGHAAGARPRPATSGQPRPAASDATPRPPVANGSCASNAAYPVLPVTPRHAEVPVPDPAG